MSYRVEVLLSHVLQATLYTSAFTSPGLGVEPLRLVIAQPEDDAADEEAPGEDGLGEDDLGEDDLGEDEGGEDASDDSSGDDPPTAESDAPPPGDPTADASGKTRARDRVLVVQPGGTFMPSFGLYGPGVRIGGWFQRWIGGFMVGGGPLLHYSYTFGGGTTFGNLTVNGDFIIGGGKFQKFAVYGHLTAGLGVAHASSGSVSAIGPGARLMFGAGGYGHITKRISLGALVDAGFTSNGLAVGVDAFLTLGFHFPK